MFVHAVAKPGNTSKLRRSVENDISPILRQQTGFQGVVVLSDSREPRYMLVLSSWESLESAEAYQTQTFPRVLSLLRPLLEAEPEAKVLSARPHLEQQEEALFSLSVAQKLTLLHRKPHGDHGRD